MPPCHGFDRQNEGSAETAGFEDGSDTQDNFTPISAAAGSLWRRMPMLCMTRPSASLSGIPQPSACTPSGWACPFRCGTSISSGRPVTVPWKWDFEQLRPELSEKVTCSSYSTKAFREARFVATASMHVREGQRPMLFNEKSPTVRIKWFLCRAKLDAHKVLRNAIFNGGLFQKCLRRSVLFQVGI